MKFNKVLAGILSLSVMCTGFYYMPDKSIAANADLLYSEFASQVLSLVNAEREKEGIAPLKLSYNLSYASSERADELVVSYSHDRPDNSDWFTILDDYEVKYIAAAENIANGYSSPELAVAGWMSSTKGHRENILNTEYEYIGIGIAYSQETDTYYWEQLFTSGDDPDSDIYYYSNQDYPKPQLYLKVNGQQSYYALPGETVTLTYEVYGAENQWCSTGVHFNFDNRLQTEILSDKSINFSKGNAFGSDMSSRNRVMSSSAFPDNIPSSQNCIFFATASNQNNGGEGVIASFSFTVPDDAANGDTYPFTFWQLNTDIFTNYERNRDMQNYAFSNWQNAEIIVKEQETTTTTTTTTTTNTTTTTTTTTATTASKATTTTTTATTEKINNNILGDVNLDNSVDITDVITIAAYVGNPSKNELTPQGLINGDVHNTGDGLTANDSLLIQQYLAGIVTKL